MAKPYCSWCGHEFEAGERAFPNRRDEIFCSATHRAASNAALKRLLAREQVTMSSNQHEGRTMSPMKPGKYVGHKFTADQEEARKLWRTADKYDIQIREALRITDHKSRVELHARLDLLLDRIERTRLQARKLFPDVNESFTVASMSISL